MPTSTPPIISEALKHATQIKIEEFEQATANFKRRYDENSILSAAEGNTLKRVTALLEQIKMFDPYLEDGDDLETMTRYLEQAKNDRSISQAKLQKFEKQLHDKLEIHWHRLDVSSLHMSLLKAAMNSIKSQIPVSADFEQVTLEEDFDMVEGQLESAFEKFEKHAFEAKEVKVDELEVYLASLFEGEAGKRALERLRENIDGYGEDIIDRQAELDEDIVEWCIKDLLQNTLLSDRKRTTLRDYLQSPAAIREMASLLNLKSVQNWNWRNPEKGLSVTARQNSEGEYCITIEEDIVDMLFLHSIAIGWSMELKDYLTDMVSDGDFWAHGEPPSPEEMAKRDYYLIAPPPPPGPPLPPMIYGEPLPPPPPPPPPPVWGSKSKRRAKGFWLPPPPPPDHRSVNAERHTNYVGEFFLSRLPKSYGSTARVTSVDDTQSKLMKYIAVEAKLCEELDGEVHGLAANLESFASSLPHKTILILLKFIGVPRQWLEAFTRFLEAPLNMGPVVRGTSDQILKRACGVSVGHGMELFFGELVLFFLDLTVHKKTGGYVYRLRDKCYFVGKSEQCLVAYESMVHFSDLAGLNLSTTHSLAEKSIGFLKFGIQKGKPVTFSIDNDKVEAHARRTKKQLATCVTALDWIRIWNSTMGKYASHLFGPLANIFGAPHLEAVTQAYNKMLTIIFETSNLTAYLTQLLTTHVDPFAPKLSHLLDPSMLEALIYLPESYGGFGVKNPYTTINLARELLADPSTPIRTYMSYEKTYYKKAFDVFATFSAQRRAEKLEVSSLPGQCSHAAILCNRDPADFFTFEEYTQNREQLHYPYLAPVSSHGGPPEMPRLLEDREPPPSFVSVYRSLLKEPRDEIRNSGRVRDEMRHLSRRYRMKGWYALSGGERWAVQMYGDECIERYGGLEAWYEQNVPGEVLRMMRGDEYDDQDDESSSTML